LTCGSLASSGVVLAVYNFTDFDKQVGAGAEILIYTLNIKTLQSGRNSVKELFGAPNVSICDMKCIFLVNTALQSYLVCNYIFLLSC